SSITFPAPCRLVALAIHENGWTVLFFYAEDATGERTRPRLSDRLGQQCAAIATAVPRAAKGPAHRCVQVPGSGALDRAPVACHARPPRLRPTGAGHACLHRRPSVGGGGVGRRRLTERSGAGPAWQGGAGRRDRRDRPSRRAGGHPGPLRGRAGVRTRSARGGTDGDLGRRALHLSGQGPARSDDRRAGGRVVSRVSRAVLGTYRPVDHDPGEITEGT